MAVEDLDLYTLNDMLRDFENASFDMYRERDLWVGGIQYLFTSLVPGRDLDSLDVFRISVYCDIWAITTLHRGEMIFFDHFGSNEVKSVGDYSDSTIHYYKALHPVYYEVLERLVRMGVSELSDIVFCVKEIRRCLPDHEC